MENVRILLIEDEADISKIASKLLTVKGYIVHCASTGENGIKMAKNNHIDLIILDLGLPDHDGYEVLRMLQADEETRDIPVAIFSAMVQKNEIEKAMGLGALGFIKKPFEPLTLHDEVNTILHQISSRHEGAPESDDAIEKELRQSYLDSFDDKLRLISVYVTEENYEELIAIGHKLSGSGKSYGFEDISVIGKRIETSAETKNIDDIKEAFQLLSSLMAELKTNRN